MLFNTKNLISRESLRPHMLQDFFFTHTLTRDQDSVKVLKIHSIFFLVNTHTKQKFVLRNFVFSWDKRNQTKKNYLVAKEYHHRVTVMIGDHDSNTIYMYVYIYFIQYGFCISKYTVNMPGKHLQSHSKCVFMLV